MLLAQGSLSKEGLNCALQWMHAVREAAVAGNDKEQLAVIAYDRSALKTPISVCMQAFGALRPVALANAKEAYEINGAVLAVLPDVVVLGSQGLVQASLSTPNKGTWSKDLFLTSDRQIVFAASNAQEQFDMRGYLSVTKSHFALHSDVAFPSEPIAKAVAESVAPARIKKNLLDPSPMGDEQQREKLLEHWHVQQTQRSVAFEYVIDGSPDEMAQQLGLISAISIFGVRKYLLNAKTEEARRNVQSIAEHIVASHPKKLASLPPVPAKFELLRGYKYQSSPQDWSAWKSIDFSLSDPQYYQYRVDAAKDGKSALVIAEGDLDADGEKSRFSIRMKLDPKTRAAMAAPAIEERDPQE
jgi:hypothetical protein